MCNIYNLHVKSSDIISTYYLWEIKINNYDIT